MPGPAGTGVVHWDPETSIYDVGGRVANGVVRVDDLGDLVEDGGEEVIIDEDGGESHEQLIAAYGDPSGPWGVEVSVRWEGWVRELD